MLMEKANDNDILSCCSIAEKHVFGFCVLSELRSFIETKSAILWHLSAIVVQCKTVEGVLLVTDSPRGIVFLFVFCRSKN